MNRGSSGRKVPLLPGILILAVIAAVGGAIAFVAHSGIRTEEPEATPPLAVAVTTVSPQESFTRTRTFVGRVESRRRSEIGFEIPGTVEAVGVDDGERIEQGDMLARIDTSRLQVERENLEAQLADARAQLGLAQRDYERLSTAGAPAFADAEIDAALTARDRAAAAVARAEAALARVDVDLGKSVLRAPYDAVVTERLIDEGDVVASGTPAFTVIEADAPEARIGVATGRGGTIARGDRLPVTVEGATYSAVVRTVLPVRDLSARTVDVLLTLDADWGLVNEGDLARLTLDEAVQRRGTWLPISSLTESVRGLFAVYAVVDDGKGGLVVERREVSLDHQTADRAFVTGGFSDGTRIVTSGVHKLSPGMAVRITGPDGDGEAPAGKREDRSKDQRGETIASGSARG